MLKRVILALEENQAWQVFQEQQASQEKEA
jgi:hypothetical protein